MLTSEVVEGETNESKLKKRKRKVVDDHRVSDITADQMQEAVDIVKETAVVEKEVKAEDKVEN